MNSEALAAMSNIKITDVDPKTLVDIKTVVINEDLSQAEKVLSLIEQVKNPYCFRSGDIAVRVRFKDDGNSFADALISYFIRLKQES